MDRGEGDHKDGEANGGASSPLDSLLLTKDSTGVYRTRIENVSPSTAVVLAVATITDSDESEIEPLGSVIDPDALDSLFSPRFDGSERNGGRVVFCFSGFEVTFDGDELRLESVDGD